MTTRFAKPILFGLILSFTFSFVASEAGARESRYPKIQHANVWTKQFGNKADEKMLEQESRNLKPIVEYRFFSPRKGKAYFEGDEIKVYISTNQKLKKAPVVELLNPEGKSEKLELEKAFPSGRGYLYKVRKITAADLKGDWKLRSRAFQRRKTHRDELTIHVLSPGEQLPVKTAKNDL